MRITLECILKNIRIFFRIILKKKLKKNNFDKIVNFKAIFDSESHQQYQNLIQNEANVLNNCITINILQSLSHINTEMHDIFKW